MDTQTPSQEKSRFKRFSRKENIFYIRLTVILVITYMLVVESQSVAHSELSYVFVAFYLGTNILLARLPADYFHQKQFYYLLAAFDTSMICLAIYLIGQADSYFFIVYFLVIGIAAMSRNIKYLMLNTLMFILVYGWLMYISGQLQGEETILFALRLPFIWSFALLIGYIIDCVAQEVNKSIGDLQEKYDALVRSIDSPIFMLDLNGRVIYANDRTLNMFNRRKDEVLDRHLAELHPPEENRLFQSNLEHVLKNSEAVQFTSYKKSLDQWFLNVMSPVREFATNTIEAASVVSKDITLNIKTERALRKAYEDLKSTQDQLIQKNRMEAVGRMASGIAHQIRNPLEIILLGVEFLENTVQQDNKLARQSMEKIKEASHRANRIIEDVLKFSRSSSFALQPLNLQELLEETLEFVQHKLVRYNIRVDREVDDPELMVRADQTTLQQVFTNILTNAVEAMGQNGHLRIRAYTLKSDSPAKQETDVPKPVQGETGELGESRRQAMSRLRKALDKSRSSRGSLVVLLLKVWVLDDAGWDLQNNLDGEIPEIVEKRFRNAARENDSISRVSRTTFLCLLQEIPEEQSGIRVVERLYQSLIRPVSLAGRSVRLHARMGYTFSQNGEADVRTVLNHAREALREAQKNNTHIHDYRSGLSRRRHSGHYTDPGKVSRYHKRNGSGGWAVVEIEDDGPGMSEEVASNIFEPFYTTKQSENGTGLGLSLASLIIERHEGHIELSTRENQGTVFRIKLRQANKEKDGA